MKYNFGYIFIGYFIVKFKKRGGSYGGTPRFPRKIDLKKIYFYTYIKTL